METQSRPIYNYTGMTLVIPCSDGSAVMLQPHGDLRASFRPETSWKFPFEVGKKEAHFYYIHIDWLLNGKVIDSLPEPFYERTICIVRREVASLFLLCCGECRPKALILVPMLDIFFREDDDLIQVYGFWAASTI